MWFITAVEKMEPYPESKYFTNTGKTRCWGFYFDKEDAVHVVRENVADIQEYFYDYAVIEEYEEGISNYTGNRQWFKWNEDRQGYFEISEPENMEYICCFALG